MLYLAISDEKARLNMSRTLLNEALKRSFVKCRTVMCLYTCRCDWGRQDTCYSDGPLLSPGTVPH